MVETLRFVVDLLEFVARRCDCDEVTSGPAGRLLAVRLLVVL